MQRIKRLTYVNKQFVNEKYQSGAELGEGLASSKAPEADVDGKASAPSLAGMSAASSSLANLIKQAKINKISQDFDFDVDHFKSKMEKMLLGKFFSSKVMLRQVIQILKKPGEKRTENELNKKIKPIISELKFFK